jgi:tRNA nucleotidyltransferase/poly(A) polymerase
MEFAGLDDDSARRDFTINSMYIPLTSADGPNSKLIDPHGGAHHLRSGEVRFVGNAKERLEEDQLRAMRYIRFVASHGKNTKIPEDVKTTIEDIKDLPSVSRERIRDEFLKGLHHPDVDAVHYVKLYKELGLLNTVFPDMQFKLDVPEDFSDKKEKRLAIAWLLRNNPPAKVEQALRQGTWQNEEIRDIVHLVELAKWVSSHKQNPEVFFDKFMDMKKRFHQTGMVPSMVRQWGKMNKLPEDVLQRFISHEMDSQNPQAFKTKAYIDQGGTRTINPEITSFLGGKTPQGPEFGKAIKGIETDKFRNSLGQK